MKLVTLLPADTYIVINKSIITEEDKNNIINLYGPIIGPIALSLYFVFLHDLKLNDIISAEYNHHHLMTIMKSGLEDIKIARKTLEGVGLLKSYYKEGDTNSYVYEIYSPLSSKEFFASPILNITLYNNIGKQEYELLKEEYQLPKIDIREYTDISSSLDTTFKSSSSFDPIDTKTHNTNTLSLNSNIDFDLIISSLPKGIVNEKTFTKKLKELIEQLSFIYDLDNLKIIEILRMVINEKGTIDKDTLRIQARKYYQYNNNGKLPTLIYRTQPEYLKTPSGDNSALAQIIYMFENTTPHDFLKMKNKGAEPTARDLKLIESLLIDLKLQPAVVNVLIDYVLKKNNNKLNQAFIETIAGQWKRCNIETAKEAIELAKKENSKTIKKVETKTKLKSKDSEPVWFNEHIEKEEMTQEESEELQELLKDFR